MSSIKRIFWFGVVSPIVLAFLNYYFSSIKLFAWGHDRINEISIFTLSISTFFCVAIIFFNYKNQSRKIWYILPSFLIIFFLLYIYTIYSLSSFGF